MQSTCLYLAGIVPLQAVSLGLAAFVCEDQSQNSLKLMTIEAQCSIIAPQCRLTKIDRSQLAGEGCHRA